MNRGSMARFFISVGVSLLNGATLEKIDSCIARVRDYSFFNPGTHFATDAPDGFDDIETFDAMTAEQKQTMQAALKEMLTAGMAYCAKDLKLVE